ncbi:MAG TPA: hypothetical protein VGC36_14285, partial [Rhizomicrobium sp.]
RRGRVRVTVEPRPQPIVLALSAYEPIDWELTVAPGAVLERVIVQGYGAARLHGVPDGVPVQVVDREHICSYGYGWEVEHNGGGGNYRALLAELRALTGLTETSFQGCYTGDSFTVPHWLAAVPPPTAAPVLGDETLPRAAVSFPTCAAQTAESRYCLAAVSGGLAVLGLDSGAVCRLAAPRALPGNWSGSLAWRGEIAYLCSAIGLIRVSLRDGAWEAAQVPCAAVSDYGDALLLLSDLSTSTSTPLAAYASYADVVGGTPSHRYQAGYGFTRFTTDGERLYGAWHATAALDIIDLGSGTAQPPLPLAGHDGWVAGLSLVDAQTLAIATWPPNEVRFFDAASGASRGSIALDDGETVEGLSCIAAPPA